MHAHQISQHTYRQLKQSLFGLEWVLTSSIQDKRKVSNTANRVTLPHKSLYVWFFQQQIQSQCPYSSLPLSTEISCFKICFNGLAVWRKSWRGCWKKRIYTNNENQNSSEVISWQSVKVLIEANLADTWCESLDLRQLQKQQSELNSYVK